jgi:DNA invertase Pin-like site-specific DNA recombinase
MPKVAVYLRTSSAIQAEANGSQAQRHALTLWLRGQGLEPETDAVWFADEGYSGASTNRPAWDQLQERTRAGEFDTIACYSLSRAGRSTIDLLGFVKDMDARGVRLVFLKDNVDISTPAGRMFLTILAAMAEYEREMILDRVRSGVRAKTAKGAKPFGPLNRAWWIRGGKDAPRSPRTNGTPSTPAWRPVLRCRNWRRSWGSARTTSTAGWRRCAGARRPVASPRSRFGWGEGGRALSRHRHPTRGLG